MKTNKTFEQWGTTLPDAKTHSQGDVMRMRSAWNAALASVVEEPVLTETQIRNITLHTLDLLDWANNMTTQGNAADFITKALLSAGRIPASKATQQQEGGLTREWLMVFRIFGSSLSGEDADAILSRHTQALEAKEAEVTDKYEKVCMDLHKSMQDQGFDVEHHYQDQIATLRTELAEAKKGRYEIPLVEEWRPGVEELVICAYDQNGIYQYTLGNFHRPEPEPAPTVEQKAETVVGHWVRTGQVRTGTEKMLVKAIVSSSELDALFDDAKLPAPTAIQKPEGGV